MLNSQPVHHKWADEKLVFGASATSSNDLDPCIINDHPTVSISNMEKKSISTDDINRTEHVPSLAIQDYMEKIRELNDRLDMVKNIARPGCSYEVLNTALSYMSSLATLLSKMPQKLHASL